MNIVTQLMTGDDHGRMLGIGLYLAGDKGLGALIEVGPWLIKTCQALIRAKKIQGLKEGQDTAHAG